MNPYENPEAAGLRLRAFEVRVEANYNILAFWTDGVQVWAGEDRGCNCGGCPPPFEILRECPLRNTLPLVESVEVALNIHRAWAMGVHAVLSAPGTSVDLESWLREEVPSLPGAIHVNCVGYPAGAAAWWGTLSAEAVQALERGTGVPPVVPDEEEI